MSQDQHMKKLISLREGLHVMAERTYDAKIHEWTLCAHETVSMSVTQTGIFTNSWRIKRVLESYFAEHAKEVWERNWMES